MSRVGIGTRMAPMAPGCWPSGERRWCWWMIGRMEAEEEASFREVSSGSQVETGLGRVLTLAITRMRMLGKVKRDARSDSSMEMTVSGDLERSARRRLVYVARTRVLRDLDEDSGAKWIMVFTAESIAFPSRFVAGMSARVLVMLALRRVSSKMLSCIKVRIHCTAWAYLSGSTWKRITRSSDSPLRPPVML